MTEPLKDFESEKRGLLRRVADGKKPLCTKETHRLIELLREGSEKEKPMQAEEYNRTTTRLERTIKLFVAKMVVNDQNLASLLEEERFDCWRLTKVFGDALIEEVSLRIEAEEEDEGEDEAVCTRCGAPYDPTGACSKRQEGCQGGFSEDPAPPSCICPEIGVFNNNESCPVHGPRVLPPEPDA